MNSLVSDWCIPIKKVSGGESISMQLRYIVWNELSFETKNK